MADWEVNKSNMKWNGEVLNVGEVITTEQLGSQLRPLRTAGKIKNVGQNVRRAFTSGRRFRKVP